MASTQLIVFLACVGVAVVAASYHSHHQPAQHYNTHRQQAHHQPRHYQPPTHYRPGHVTGMRNKPLENCSLLKIVALRLYKYYNFVLKLRYIFLFFTTNNDGCCNF